MVVGCGLGVIRLMMWWNDADAECCAATMSVV